MEEALEEKVKWFWCSTPGESLHQKERSLSRAKQNIQSPPMQTKIQGNWNMHSGANGKDQICRFGKLSRVLRKCHFSGQVGVRVSAQIHLLRQTPLADGAMALVLCGTGCTISRGTDFAGDQYSWAELCSPQNPYIEVLTPEPQDVIVYGNTAFI